MAVVEVPGYGSVEFDQDIFDGLKVLTVAKLRVMLDKQNDGVRIAGTSAFNKVHYVAMVARRDTQSRNQINADFEAEAAKNAADIAALAAKLRTPQGPRVRSVLTKVGTRKSRKEYTKNAHRKDYGTKRNARRIMERVPA